MIADGVEAREDSQGCLQLRRCVEPGRGLGGFLAERLGFRRPLRVNLDATGTLFWKQIDGRRSLREIERIVRQRAGLEREDSEKAVVLFTKMLMLRRLVNLKLPARRD